MHKKTKRAAERHTVSLFHFCFHKYCTRPPKSAPIMCLKPTKCIAIRWRAGNDYNSGQQLLEALWAYEEWKIEKKIESDADFVARAEELRRQRSDRSTTLESQSSNSLNNSQSLPASSPTPEDSICVVCMTNSRSVVLIPCGHLAVCQSCYGRLQQCPICRAVIRGAIRSFMS